MKKRFKRFLFIFTVLLVMYVPMQAQASQQIGDNVVSGGDFYNGGGGAVEGGDVDVWIPNESSPEFVYCRLSVTPLTLADAGKDVEDLEISCELDLTEGETFNSLKNKMNVPAGFRISGGNLWNLNKQVQDNEPYYKLKSYMTVDLAATVTEDTLGFLRQEEESMGVGVIDWMLVPDTSTSVASCNHPYSEWDTWYMPTEESDGMEALYCTVCREVLQTREISAMAYWLNKVEKEIRTAPEGATVKVETEKWISFWDKILIALDDNPDVSLECNYKYKGEWDSFLIPARMEGEKLKEDNVGWYGFLYLKSKYDMDDMELKENPEALLDMTMSYHF